MHIGISSKAKQLAITIVAVSLVCVGVGDLVLPHERAAWQRNQGRIHNNATLYKAEQVTTQTPTMHLGTPKHISLPRLGVNLDVETGIYDTPAQTWAIDHTHAFLMQAPKGEIATPIIYGHDIPKVFANLAGAASDELLYVTNTEGQTLLFRYSGDQTLNPADSSILTTYFPDTVFLMTCSGSQYQYRRALQFTYVGMENSTPATSEASV